MSSPEAPPPLCPASAAHPSLAFLPVLHGAVEVSCELARAVEDWAPSLIAVELAPALERTFEEAVLRLPHWSVLLFEDDRDKSYAQVIHPVDPLVEAVRIACESGVPWRPIDADVAVGTIRSLACPDPYAIRSLGLGAFLDQVRGARGSEASLAAPVDPQDRLREIVMAVEIATALAEGQRVLAVVGLEHVAGIERALLDASPRPVYRPQVTRPVLFNLHPESLPELVGHAPLIDTLFELRRSMPPPLPETERRDGAAARAPSGARFPFEVLEGTRESEAEMLRRIVVEMVATTRVEASAFVGLDRALATKALFDGAAELYARNTHTSLAPWQWASLDRFLMKLTRREERLVPDLYQCVTAARGAIDDNFAWETLRLASYCPWQSEWSDLPTTRLSAEALRLGTREIRIRRRLPRNIRRHAGFPLRRRPTTDDPRAWEADFEDARIVSYPPEDLTIEAFASACRQGGASLFSGGETRVEPFSVSYRDGLDLRETLRHVDDGRIWVREEERGAYDADALVLIFDEDDAGAGARDHEKGISYPFRMTWLGEHQNESDMAFYSTHPLENVVGPGISRCEYGGLMMIIPPMQLYDVWRIKEYQRIASGPGELLCIAALDYSRRRDVIHVAARPPSDRLRAVARRLGRRLVHLPLGSFDPERIKKLRSFHILNGRRRRSEVKKYLW